jgi:predicted nuclease of restriction endonuclease-like RecB superfamily
MLFPLSSIKKRGLRDRRGNLIVVPALLHGRTALALVEQAINVFESCVGRPRSEYDPRALEAVMGDYRLGRCIEACLLTRYSFVQPRLESLLSQEQISALAEKGLNTPSDLRLALWDAANARHGGFVPPGEREAFVRRLAAEWGLPPDATLMDALLTLDSDARAVLTRTGERPTAHQILRLYNLGVVSTLLAHSTHVQFDLSSLPGAVLKKLYFIARREGILVDVDAGPAGGYTLVLYGPERASASDRYGRKLADTALRLLRMLQASEHAGAGVPAVEGVAHLVIHDRQYRFYLADEVMRRLGYLPESAQALVGARVAETGAAYSVGSALSTEEGGDNQQGAEPSFDSLIEAGLYREFRSLQKQGYTHGWLIQREPDPLLAPGMVLIPDFALVRGDVRVYMEIAGFWSPAYRERKLAKLRSLASAYEGKGVVPLVLAVPQEAGQAFAGLPFPTLTYKNGVRATDLLAVLDRHYGRREERWQATLTRVEALRHAANERGFVPEREVAEALQAYTRSELLAGARSLADTGCRYVAGVGLLSDEALDRARAALERAVSASPHHRIALHEAAALAREALSAPDEVDIEALVQVWPDWHIQRPSLFDAYLTADA